MTLKLRFALLLGILLLGAALGLFVLHWNQQGETALVLDKIRAERERLLDRLLTLLQQQPQQFSRDYSLWDEMAKFVETGDRNWAAINIDPSLSNFNAKAVWVFRPDLTLIYAVAHGASEEPPMPMSLEHLRERIAHERFPHFFVDYNGTLFEIHGAPIQPSADIKRTSSPAGWMFVARHWNRDFLQNLAQLTDSRVFLKDAGGWEMPESPFAICVQRDLKDLQGNALATLHVHHQPPQLELIADADRRELWLALVEGLLAVLLIALCLQLWVLRPFARISESLATDNTEPLAPLLTRRDELGRVANLVLTSFAARNELHQALEDRARLGRDLHDGVIQSIYAAGMSLAGVRAVLRDNPAEAIVRLDQTHVALNTTIRDVRNFIIGLEPEALRQKTFKRAVCELLEFLQSARAVNATVEIDDVLATRLPRDHKVHALQIARESLSNALRHGKARHVAVRLRASPPNGAELIVEDDGSGFSPGTQAGAGQGLANLAERARELGASLTVESEPGRGTCVRLIIPLPSSLT